MCLVYVLKYEVNRDPVAGTCSDMPVMELWCTGCVCVCVCVCARVGCELDPPASEQLCSGSRG